MIEPDSLLRRLKCCGECKGNLHSEQREGGSQADRPNSGATLAYLSPGIGMKITPRLDAFAFIQLPVWQRVNGLQLEPQRLWSVGVQYRF